MITIKEKLIEQFGDSAKGIINIDSRWMGGQPCTSSFFACSGNGNLQTLCGGGKVIMGFKPDPVMKGLVYLIVNDSSSKDWDRRRTQGEGFSTLGERPCEYLELVYSQ